jgi:hypothetical protein
VEPDLALQYDSGALTYDMYCGLACQTVSVDLLELQEKLSLLISDPQLRRKFGAAGRERARAIYDWSHVYRAYLALWAELRDIRHNAATSERWSKLLSAAPRSAAARLDPFAAFSHYPTERLSGATRVGVTARPDGLSYDELIASPLYSYVEGKICSKETVAAILGALNGSAMSIDEVAAHLGEPTAKLMAPVAMLAKMGLLRPL